MSPCNEKGVTYHSDAAVSISLPALNASWYHNQIQHHVYSDALLTSSYDELHARNLTDSSCKARFRAQSIHFHILRKRSALNISFGSHRATSPCRDQYTTLEPSNTLHRISSIDHHPPTENRTTHSPCDSSGPTHTWPTLDHHLLCQLFDHYILCHPRLKIHPDSESANMHLSDASPLLPNPSIAPNPIPAIAPPPSNPPFIVHTSQMNTHPISTRHSRVKMPIHAP
jgi:hypothetical protein